MRARSTDAAPATGAAAYLPKPVMTPRLAATVLLLEAFCVFFGTLTAVALSKSQGPADGPGNESATHLWIGGGVLFVLLVLLSGVVRRPGGLVAGTIAQGVLIATGVVVPAMWVVGAAFALLWVWLVSVGRRIDADRRRWLRTANDDVSPPPGPAEGSAPPPPA